jgi:hypothetical protein
VYACLKLAIVIPSALTSRPQYPPSAARITQRSCATTLFTSRCPSYPASSNLLLSFNVTLLSCKAIGCYYLMTGSAAFSMVTRRGATPRNLSRGKSPITIVVTSCLGCNELQVLQMTLRTSAKGGARRGQILVLAPRHKMTMCSPTKVRDISVFTGACGLWSISLPRKTT